MSEFKAINTADIPQELRDTAQRYAQKAKIANYMRSVAYGAFIDGALWAKGIYIQHHDKDWKELKIEEI